MKSIFDDNQINEKKSRLFFDEKCTRLGWKFRDYNMDNDIDGEIEVFDINKRGQYETNASYVKVQLKSTQGLTLEGDLKYDLPVKFLNFADACDQPIILFLYDVNSENGYWLWVQRYIFNELDISSPGWRDNANTVRIKINRENNISDLEKFKEDIEFISMNGIAEIQQYRKFGELGSYYTELGIEDNSNPLQRKLSVNILIEKSISSNKNVVRRIIKELNEKYKTCDYFKHEDLKKVHTDDIVDILLLYFYNDLRQKQNGLPECKTVWLKPNKDTGFIVGKPQEKLAGINVFWNENKALEQIYINARMQKSEYVNLIDELYIESYTIANLIKSFWMEYSSKEISDSELIEKTKDLSKVIDELYLKSEDRDLPPYECCELDQLIRQCICSLDNMKVCLNLENREIRNKVNNIKIYLRMYFEDIGMCEYLIKKIR